MRRSRRLWKTRLSERGHKHKCRLDAVVCDPRFSPFISQTPLECVWVLKTHTKPQTHTHTHTSHTLSHPHNRLTYVTEHGQIFFFLKPTNHVVFETTAYGLHSFCGGRNKYELVDWCSIFPFSANAGCCWFVWKPEWSKNQPTELHVVLSSRGRAANPPVSGLL